MTGGHSIEPCTPRQTDASSRIARHLAQRNEIQLEIEVSAVTNDRAIFHRRKMFAVDHVAIAGDRHEDIANRDASLIGITRNHPSPLPLP
jgi:hypothetical protein